MVTVASYNRKYLKMKPEVAQIFEDLEAYHNFIRMQYPQVKFDEADLYNNKSPMWQKFERQRAKKNKTN